MLKYIKYIITANTHTIWIPQQAIFTLTVYNSQHVTLEIELLNSVVVIVTYIDHSISINGYPVRIVKFPQTVSLATKVVRVGEVRIKDLDTMVTRVSNIQFPTTIYEQLCHLVS